MQSIDCGTAGSPNFFYLFCEPKPIRSWILNVCRVLVYTYSHIYYTEHTFKSGNKTISSKTKINLTENKKNNDTIKQILP